MFIFVLRKCRLLTVHAVVLFCILVPDRTLRFPGLRGAVPACLKKLILQRNRYFDLLVKIGLWRR